MRLERVMAAVVGVGAVALLGGLYVYGRRLRDERGDEGADVTDVLGDAVRTAAGAKVLDRERAAGVDGRLHRLLDDWDREGTHVVRVAGGTFGGHVYVGGVRDFRQQVSDAQAGLSKALPVDDVDSTKVAPHMRAGALDVWPEGFVPHRSFAEQPVPDDYVAKFRAFAEFARARGFVAGFFWKNPDMPHVEVSDWRGLPVHS